jgi:Txe/YoeB family toxin of Txe-Axe toxin-antitoxin module
MNSPRRSIRLILTGQAKEEYELLRKVVEEQKKKGIANSEEIQLLKSINNKIELLKLNPVYGQGVPKRLIPDTLDVDNLFRVELTSYWRMLYTLKTNQIEIVNFILYIVDHKAYDKLFGYKFR